MHKLLTALLSACFLASCTSPPKTPQKENPVMDASVPELDAQSAVLNCVTPHEAYTFPPQPVPGIPVILTRHGECMGTTNIVVAIWPGGTDRVNLLYVQMLVESYLIHLKKMNEMYTASVLSAGEVQLPGEDSGYSSEIVTSAAVFKLSHLQEKEEK